MENRAPVVVVMGHIDHGKTTLLDYIRKTKVASSESGLITQHVGAYEVEVKDNKITFIDTPGHEAFTSIRERGTSMADIAILIIAADESIKPQTREAIFHIKNNNIPYIVAINKVDKPGVNLEKVKNDLAQEEIYLEGRGGDVPFVEISALRGDNIDGLLELILLIAEINEIKGAPDTYGQGFVIESQMDPKRGIEATVIIKNGTIKKGDKIYTKNSEGKIKILESFKGEKISKASFSAPVKIVGFTALPNPGEQIFCGNVPEDIIELLKEEEENKCVAQIIGENEKEIIHIISKADVLGSCEALLESLKTLAKKLDVSFYVLNSSTGILSERDIKLIDPKQEIVVLCFRTKTDEYASSCLKQSNAKVFQGQTIYELLTQLEEYVNQREKEPVKEIYATLDVLAIFNSVKGNQLIGGELTKGQIKLNAEFEIVREEEIIGKGKVLNIQCSKETVKEIGCPNQCGLIIDTKTQIEKKDRFDFYTLNK